MKIKIMDEKKKFFDVWMYEVNEDIQSLAEAFGERFILQNAWIGLVTCTHKGAKNLIEKSLKVHMLNLINQNLAYYLRNDLISNKLGAKI